MPAMERSNQNELPAGNNGIRRARLEIAKRAVELELNDGRKVADMDLFLCRFVPQPHAAVIDPCDFQEVMVPHFAYETIADRNINLLLEQVGYQFS